MCRESASAPFFQSELPVSNYTNTDKAVVWLQQIKTVLPARSITPSSKHMEED